MATSKQASRIHMHVRNSVTLVWGSLRLAPINSGSYGVEHFTDIVLMIQLAVIGP